MIKEDLFVLDKFKLVKDLGFYGIEFDSFNDLNDKEILKVKWKIGLEIFGVVNFRCWKMFLFFFDFVVRV